MKTWIHLKSDNLADALALATILRESDKSFHIVRRSFNAYVFAGLNNVILDYYEKSEDCEIIVIDEISTDIWQEKCNNIATKIGVITKGKHVPYLGFTKQRN